MRAEVLTAAWASAQNAESLSRAVRAAEERVERIAEEQAALRRVATLVARAAPPEEVFAAVAAEIGQLLNCGFTVLSRYDPDGTAVAVGAWNRTGAATAFTVGTRWILGGRNVTTLVSQTSRPTRIDAYAGATGPAADLARERGARSIVGVPISVEGRLWGVMSAVSTSERPLPADTEPRLAGFTELVATAIANTQARVELRGFAEEQAALRRVATLVARAAPPEKVFAAVTEEAGRLLKVDFTHLSRYDADGAATMLGTWNITGGVGPVPVGTRWSLGGWNVTTMVFETGRPARIDEYGVASGDGASVGREWGFCSAVGVPINVEGRLWGFMLVAYTHEEPLPPDTEARLAGFAELVATAVANALARVELRGFAEEQAALRRVATLVARAAQPEKVFAAVTEEAGRLLKVDFTQLSRYDPDSAATVVGTWNSAGGVGPVPVGTRWILGGWNVTTMVFETGRPARIDEYGGASGPAGEFAREVAIHSAVGAPISVAGRLWGFMLVAYTHEEALPADTEERLAGFTELVATAIANAESQAQLTASRARIVAAADHTRHRIERDLHDGAQQRLVSLALELRSALAAAPPQAGDLVQQLGGVAAEVGGVLDELREIARGLHPAALAEGGLRPALTALAHRSPIPVRLDASVVERLPEPIEIAAYYVVAESLTNTAKHAHASVVDVEVEVAAGDGVLRVGVSDDGVGGANFTRGSGLVGLKDRVEALGGRISLRSPPGAGTAVQIALPLGGPGRAGLPAGIAGPLDDAGCGPAASPGPPGPSRGS
jgi:signal transduction histidine kinase